MEIPLSKAIQEFGEEVEKARMRLGLPLEVAALILDKLMAQYQMHSHLSPTMLNLPDEEVKK